MGCDRSPTRPCFQTRPASSRAKGDRLMSIARLRPAADAPLHDAGLERGSPPRRVVHVIGDGRPGGGTTFVLNLATATAGHGFEPVIVTQENSYLLQRAREAGVTAIGMDFATRVRSLALSRRLKKALIGLDPA